MSPIWAIPEAAASRNDCPPALNATNTSPLLHAARSGVDPLAASYRAASRALWRRSLRHKAKSLGPLSRHGLPSLPQPGDPDVDPVASLCIQQRCGVMTDQTRTIQTLEGVDELRAVFNGEVVLPGDENYDNLRAHFNELYDKRPAVILRPTGTADVVVSSRFARSAGLEIAVSSGGKHSAGFSRSDNGAVIDLSLMRAVHVDPQAQTAWLQTGANGGDLQAEALVHGLGGVIGWMRGTGVGGVNLHGGFGMLTAKLGYGVDTILEIELVTAEGEVLRVSADSHPDLFWGVRGAASNFGVVTWVKQRLTPVPPQILAGQLIYDAQHARGVLAALDQYTLEASDDLTIFGSYTVVPEDDTYPAEMQGAPALVLTVVHIGEADEANQELDQLRALQPVDLDFVASMGLYDFICSMDAYIVAGRQCFDTLELGSLSSETIDLIARGAEDLAELGLEGEIIIVPQGRGRIPQVPSALRVGARGTTDIVTGIYWQSPADDERAKAWATGVIANLRGTGVAKDEMYGNMTNFVDLDRDRRSYGEDDWMRLTKLKAQYDPQNVFHLNHNIPPAS
jgi:FAD/FMN-containing dehydrogenase